MGGFWPPICEHTHTTDGVMKYGWHFKSLLTAWLFCLATSTAFAQENAPDDASDSNEQTVENDEVLEENDDDSALFETAINQDAPDGTQDYEEIHQLRTLERTLLPPQTLQTSSDTGTLLPGNQMELSGNTALEQIFRSQEAVGTNRGLQRKASLWMSEATAQVRAQLNQNKNSMDLPFGIDCTNQPAVQEYVAIFSAGAAGTMKTWLKRLERWRPVLETALHQENVPTDLIYLAMIESGFKTRVRSPMAAAGMWQFMAGTGVEMGLVINEWVDERYDPVKAAHAAARYLKKQFARYNSWPLAMAAYNGGPGTVNVAIDRYNTNDYFKLVEYGAMYDETRKYVPRIMAAAIIGKNPAAFGLDGLKPEPPFVFDSIEVPGNTKLKLLSQAAGCSIETLQELNPELLKDQTPPGDHYTLRIPLNSHNAFVTKFDQIQKKYADANDTITLRFGETLATLGNEIGVAPRVLRYLNGIGARDDAAYGSEIIVPNGSKRRPEAAPKDENDRPLCLISPETFTFSNRKQVFYETQKGDSIREIADAFHVLPNQVAIWNELDPWAKLRPKMFLQIFVPHDADLKNIRYHEPDELHIVTRGSQEHMDIVEARKNASSKAAKTAAKSKTKSGSKSEKSSSAEKPSYITHTVKKGDSLSKIAKKYDVTVDALLKLNKLKENASLRKGQVLKIKKK